MRLSFDTISDILRSKLRAGIPNSDSWPWLRDVYPDTVVYQLNGDYFERTYAIDDNGQVTMGEPTPVVISREYVPVTGFSVTVNEDGTADLYGRVFRLGEYPDKGFSLTDHAEADQMVSRFNARGGCKNNLEHKVKTVLGHELGTLTNLSRIGEELWGTLHVPAWLSSLGDAQLGPDAVQVSLEFASGLSGPGTRDIIGNALTFTPRIEDATLVAFARGIESNPRTKSTDMDEKGFFGKLAAMFGAAAGDPAPAPVPPNNTPSPAPAPQFGGGVGDPTTIELQKQVALRDKALVAARAKAFADEQVAAKKALPAEHAAISSMFAGALEADSAGVIKFTATGEIEEGAACKAHRDYFAAKQAHQLTEEKVPAAPGATGNPAATPDTLAAAFANLEPGADLPVGIDLKQFGGIR